MPVLSEGHLTFHFPSGDAAERVDDWAFYRQGFVSVPGTKSVDFVCVHGDSCWLIEVKDYRFHSRTKTVSLCEEVACKVRDSLAMLAAARRNANNENEKNVAAQALASRTWRVALHLEQPPSPSRARPTYFDPASVLMKLRGFVRRIDPHPVVASIDAPRGHWHVSRSHSPSSTLEP